MKILSILLAILILLIPLTACSNQPDSTLTFTEEGNPTLEAQILGITVALQDLNTRLVELEELIIGSSLSHPPNIPVSIEERVRALEEKVMGSQYYSTPPFSQEDEISRLEKRVSTLEQKLGISSWGW